MLLRLTAAVLLSVSAFSAEVTPFGGHRAEAGAETTGPSDDSAPDTTVNPFLPERENVSDCFGGVPRPNCGTKEHGGWRQGLVFGAVVAGMALIGARLVIAVRRRAPRRAG